MATTTLGNRTRLLLNKPVSVTESARQRLTSFTHLSVCNPILLDAVTHTPPDGAVESLPPPPALGKLP